jgi:hypothetical protein
MENLPVYKLVIDDSDELNSSMNKSLPLIDAAKIQPEVNNKFIKNNFF